MTTIQTQYLRVYSTPIRDEQAKKKKRTSGKKTLSQEAETIERILKPWGGLTLIFDTETTIGTSQKLRFGFYEIHGLTREELVRRYLDDTLKPEDANILRECGLFYNPETISQEELKHLQTYAMRVTPEIIARRECAEYQPLNIWETWRKEGKTIKLYTVQQFITLFYYWQSQHEMLVIGHNLPFDLGVLATSWVEAEKKMKSGFSLKLCTCPYKHCFKHPNIRVKHIGYAKSFIKRMETNWNKKLQPVHFLDTMTLTASLLGTAHSLDTLSSIMLPDYVNTKNKRRKNKLQKRARPDTLLSGACLTMQDIIYGISDVHSTWACYRELKQHFNSHDIPHTAIWELYSSASIGKAHLKEFGVRPFLEQHPDFPKHVLGYSMNAYYGARCEIGIRKQPVEVLYLDFLSQYPTVNTLMKNQDILLAERVEIEENTPEIKALLEQDVPTLLDWLHVPAHWPELRCFVKVLPNKDRLPLRSDYGRDEKNVGLPYVTSSTPVWYTLADVLGSKLLTSKTPEIIEAIRLVPSEEKYKTKVRELFGYSIDLEKQDFFKTLIELRQEKKKQTGLLAENEQLALKLISNATAYGALVEITQGETTQEAQDACYYDGEGQERQTKIHRVETPGRFFAGPVGSLIPAAGRLLLAIAQRLTNDRGMVHAMMDTDSIAIARPSSYNRETFREKAQEVADWFSALSPYAHNKKVLEVEKVNYRWDDRTGKAEKNELEPLYFLGISAKRYVVYNKLPDGTYRIRKFSSHGLGGIHAPYGDSKSPFTDIPAPCQDVKELGGKRWCYDMWYGIIDATEKGTRYRIPDVFNVPCYHRATITTWKLYEQYNSDKDRKPFGFFTVLPSKADALSDFDRAMEDDGSDDLEASITERLAYIKTIKKPFYAPFANMPENLHDIRRMDDNTLLPGWYRLITVKEVIRDYAENREWKAANGDKTGIMSPYDVTIGDIVYVGKEINSIALEQTEETNGLLGSLTDINVYGKEATQNWRDVLSKYHIADVCLLTGLSNPAIHKHKKGESIPTPETKQLYEEAIATLEKADNNRLQWHKYSNQELAARLNVSQEDVQAMKWGRHRFTESQREILKSL